MALNLTEGEEKKDKEWKKISDTSKIDIPVSIKGFIDQKDGAFLGAIGKDLCIYSNVATMGNEYNKETEKLENKRFGMMLTVQRLGDSFVNRISRLTGVEVNLFTKAGLGSGTLSDYNKLNGELSENTPSNWDPGCPGSEPQ